MPVIHRYLLLAVLLCISLPGYAGDSLELLTIGNSFAWDALAYLRPLAKEGGKEIVILPANIGGCSMERHARHLAQAEAGDPEGFAYKNVTDPTTGKSRDFSLPEALALLPWDVVTIQQVSHQSFRPESFQPHADQLIAAIRKYAPTAEIIVHQTWAYRDDHPVFRRNDGFSPLKMHEQLRVNYLNLANENGFRILPVGDAFHLARQTPRWSYTPDPDFDFENPPEGRLPDQRTSLFAGWKWAKDKKTGEMKLNLDAIHCNAAGKYLAGAVWYQVLFETDEVPAGFVPKGLTAEDAADLRRHAAAAVEAVAPVKAAAAR